MYRDRRVVADHRLPHVALFQRLADDFHPMLILEEGLHPDAVETDIRAAPQHPFGIIQWILLEADMADDDLLRLHAFRFKEIELLQPHTVRGVRNDRAAGGFMSSG